MICVCPSNKFYFSNDSIVHSLNDENDIYDKPNEAITPSKSQSKLNYHLNVVIDSMGTGCYWDKESGFKGFPVRQIVCRLKPGGAMVALYRLT